MKKKYIAIGFWVLCLLGFFMSKFLYGFSYEQIALYIYHIFSKTGTIGALLFIILYGLRPLVFFPASFMSVMGGALYGPVFGVVYVIIGSNIGGQLGYHLGKVLGNSVSTQKLDSKFLKFFYTNAKTKGFISVLSARMLFIPYDPVSYLSGILAIKWTSYSIATLLGTLPATLVFVLAGASLYRQNITAFSDIFADINTSLLYFAAGIFIMSLVFSKILRKKFSS